MSKINSVNGSALSNVPVHRNWLTSDIVKPYIYIDSRLFRKDGF